MGGSEAAVRGTLEPSAGPGEVGFAAAHFSQFHFNNPRSLFWVGDAHITGGSDVLYFSFGISCRLSYVASRNLGVLVIAPSGSPDCQITPQFKPVRVTRAAWLIVFLLGRSVECPNGLEGIGTAGSPFALFFSPPPSPAHLIITPNPELVCALNYGRAHAPCPAGLFTGSTRCPQLVSQTHCGIGQASASVSGPNECGGRATLEGGGHLRLCFYAGTFKRLARRTL